MSFHFLIIVGSQKKDWPTKMKVQQETKCDKVEIEVGIEYK